MAPHRNVVPSLPHHVYARGNNQRSLFSYPYERAQFLYYLGRAKLKWPCELNAIALMTNHIHLVVVPPDQQHLSKLMAHTLQRYAQYRNDARGTTGKLFEERFHCEPLDNDAYLASTLAYVDLNPVHGGVEDDPARCEWSTYGLHVPSSRCRIPSGLWTPSPWYLGLGADQAERSARYAEWVRDCRERKDAREALLRLETKEAFIELARDRRVRRPDGRRSA